MSSKTPTVRQIAWISIIPQLLILGTSIYIWKEINDKNYLVFGASSYLVLSFALRNFIPRHHRKGMKKVKKGSFADAIPNFQDSYNFFIKYDWIDRYRFITLLSSSRMSYKEMALNNIAFCYGQAGNGEKSKEYYQRTLAEFPDSGMAQAGLKMLESMEQK